MKVTSLNHVVFEDFDDEGCRNIEMDLDFLNDDGDKRAIFIKAREKGVFIESKGDYITPPSCVMVSSTYDIPREGIDLFDGEGNQLRNVITDEQLELFISTYYEYTNKDLDRVNRNL